jgi:sodium-dependent dicarboxylate transporter 2/3/5
MRTLGIFLWTITWWTLEPIPIPVTSLMSLALLALCGVMTVDAAFVTWSNWIVLFLIGASIIGHAMNIHGLARRFAYRVASSRFVAGNPWRILLLFGIGATVLSSVLSNTVTTMIFMSIALGLAGTLRLQQGSRFAEAIYLAIAWGSTAGGIITPVGAPTNLIAIGMANSLGYRIGFLQWTLIGLPVSAVIVLAMLFVFRYVIPPEMPDWQIEPSALQNELKKLGPLTRQEKVVAAVFLATVLLWMLPDLLPLFLAGGRQNYYSIWVIRNLDWSVTAVLMAASLFVIPVNWKSRRFAMTWDEAMKGVEWGAVSLVAAALGLGNAIAHRTLGVGPFLEQIFSSLSGAAGSQFLFLLGLVGFTIILTSFISNLAAVGMVGAVVQAIGSSTGLNPIALLVAVGLAANMAFPLPVGTPYNAIVFASGYVRIGTMIKGGTVLGLLSTPAVALIGYYGASLILN